MNNSRRKRINQSILSLKSTKDKIQKALDEEKTALAQTPDDNEHEEMREAMDEIISNLEETISCLEDAIDTLNNANF